MVKQGAFTLIKIRDDYALLLDAFAGSDARLLRRNSQRLLLRHDVDHNLELALRLGEVEAEARIKSTFFVRTDTQYASKPDFINKISYLESLGHEIGYHCNAMSQAVQTKGSVSDIVATDLQKLRRGASVRGVSAHGDSTNYALNVSNLWTWSENEATYSARVYLGGKLTAEGTVTDSNDRFIDEFVQSEPESRSRVARYSVSAEQYGLEYEAVFITPHIYWSDSGGQWKRTGCPTSADLSFGSHQVLVHPEYVFISEKPIFVMSFPRSGTTFLQNSLRQVGIQDVEHETALNLSRFKYRLPGIQKRTNFAFNQVKSKNQMQSRLINSWMLSRQPKNGYIPAVVEPYGALLDSKNIDILHSRSHSFGLVRHPVETVLSLVERGWHSQPLSLQHPSVLERKEWEELDQIEKICTLWTDSYRKLLEGLGYNKILRIEDLSKNNPGWALNTFGLGPTNKYLLPSKIQNESRISASEVSRPSLDMTDGIWDIVGPLATEFGYEKKSKYKKRAPLGRYAKNRLSDFESGRMWNAEKFDVLDYGSGDDYRSAVLYDLMLEDMPDFLAWKLRKQDPLPGVVIRLFKGNKENPFQLEMGRLDPSFRESSGSVELNSKNEILSALFEYPIGKDPVNGANDLIISLTEFRLLK